MVDPSVWVAVGAGGAAGAIVRGMIFRGVELWSERARESRWTQWGAARSTVIVNVLGSFLLGLLVAGVDFSAPSVAEPLGAFWTTGVCGAITTFSTLCADAFSLARSHGRRHVAGTLLANTLLGLAALSLGILIGP